MSHDCYIMLLPLYKDVPDIKKQFYFENPEVAAMTADQVEDFR